MKNEDLINKFNTMFPVGSKVRWRSVGKDGVPYEVLTVQDSAVLLSGHSAVAWFKERIGCCSIEERFVDYTPVVDEPAFQVNAINGPVIYDVASKYYLDREGSVLPCHLILEKLNDSKPLDIVLHCPNCKMQHIDRAEPDKCETCGYSEADHNSDEFKANAECVRFLPWLNDPHKSHRCHGCNHVWRPADIPTNGVEAAQTRGANDTWPEVALRK